MKVRNKKLVPMTTALMESFGLDNFTANCAASILADKTDNLIASNRSTTLTRVRNTRQSLYCRFNVLTNEDLKKELLKNENIRQTYKETVANIGKFSDRTVKRRVGQENERLYQDNKVPFVKHI